MNLPLKVGLPLLVALLVGSSFAEGFERTAVLVAAMAVALWTAFSLPHVRRPPPEEPPPDEAEAEPPEEEPPADAEPPARGRWDQGA